MRVKRLEIDLESNPVIPLNYDFVFSYYMYMFAFPKENCAYIKSLTHLSLKSVNITGECLEHFLSHCLLLEWLAVDRSRDLVNLKVSGLSLLLKFLKISRCTRLESVEICAPKLVTFIYFGMSDRIEFDVSYAPSLIELSVGQICDDSPIYAFLSFSSYFSKIESLTLMSMSTKMTSTAPPQIPELISLKDLTWQVSSEDDGDSLLHWTWLINAAPFLQRFSLQLQLDFWSSIERGRRRYKVTCPHQCLKVVEFVGFVGGVMDYELGMYFIENAVALEKFIIDCRPVMFGQQPQGDFTETKRTRMEKHIAVELKKKLKRNSRSRAKIEII